MSHAYPDPLRRLLITAPTALASILVTVDITIANVALPHMQAAMSASHYRLDNLCAIVDNNGLQIDGFCCDVMSIEPVVDKWRGFGWHVIDIDGHDMTRILGALAEAEDVKGRPTVIVARTVKGKGVSFFEGKAEYHGAAPTAEELEKALKELH